MNLVLYCLLCTPLFAGFYILFLPADDFYRVRDICLYTSFFIIFLALTLFRRFDYLNSNFQFCYYSYDFLLDDFFLQWLFGVDGFSIIFVLLTAFIFPLCFFSIFFKDIIFFNLYISFFFFLEFAILGTFLSLDLLLFFFFFEIILIPMIFIIGIWGSTLRKVRAMYLFLLYTAVGSVFILFAIFLIILDKQSTNFYYLFYNILPFTQDKQIILWFLFFFGLAVKIPIFPFHIWLPEAHVEAPTEGSIILASLLLKLGGYGFLRTSLPLCPNATLYYLPIIYTFNLLGLLYCSLIAIRQNDLKKIIAYSSVAHMNLVVLGLFSINIQGLQGAILLMVGHALSSSGLFFLVGCLYDRHKIRLLNYYGGLVQTMPFFSSFFFFLSLTNFSFPGTSNFIGEILILIGIFETNTFVTCLAAFSGILTVTYSIWLFNRIVFSTIKFAYIKHYADLLWWEFRVLGYISFGVIAIGLYPKLILNITYMSSMQLLQFLEFGCIA
jgi:proton-translocating NADH-quinone oxidoreductase chain M